MGAQEARVLAEFCKHYGIPFRDLGLLKLALTHRSYLSVTGQGPRESNERLEFLGDSVLGLVTSEFLYRRHPDEHEGQLTKTKSLLVSKAILSRRALRMGLGRFVLMSHSEVESGGRQRLSILADAFESVLGAIYLDQGFEAARTFITQHLLSESDAISSDKRHTNYKSHLQEYVQNSFRTHPVYRIRSEFGPDHSKHFMVEVMVGKRTLGEGRGHNKKEAEQAAARDALEKVEKLRRQVRDDVDQDDDAPETREHGERSSNERSAGEREPRRGRERDRERKRDPRDPRPDRGRGRSEPLAALPSSAPEPPARDDVEDDEEAGDDAAGSRRRRRSRRGGRGRHAGARDGISDTATPPAAPEDDADGRDDDERSESPRYERDEPRHEPKRVHARDDDDDDDDDEDDDELPLARPAVEDDEADDFTEAVRAEGRERSRTESVRGPDRESPRTVPPASVRADVEDDVDVEDDARPGPPVPLRPAAPAPVSFGRGKRRASASGPVAPAAAKPGPAPGPVEVTEPRRHESFAPEPVRDTEAAARPPVIDVPAAEPDAEEETEAERDARIEEMERALDNFGRRKSTNHGRRRR
ncbi:MAG: ribonuclease III [Candidatus Eisenbacteria bacterium]